MESNIRPPPLPVLSQCGQAGAVTGPVVTPGGGRGSARVHHSHLALGCMSGSPRPGTGLRGDSGSEPGGSPGRQENHTDSGLSQGQLVREPLLMGPLSGGLLVGGEQMAGPGVPHVAVLPEVGVGRTRLPVEEVNLLQSRGRSRGGQARRLGWAGKTWPSTSCSA